MYSLSCLVDTQDLLAEQGPAYDINLQVFHGLQSTITGWPGGKPSAASAAASAKSSTDGGHPQVCSPEAACSGIAQSQALARRSCSERWSPADCSHRCSTHQLTYVAAIEGSEVPGKQKQKC